MPQRYPSSPSLFSHSCFVFIDSFCTLFTSESSPPHLPIPSIITSQSKSQVWSCTMADDYAEDPCLVYCYFFPLVTPSAAAFLIFLHFTLATSSPSLLFTLL